MHLFIVFAVVCIYALRDQKPVISGAEYPLITLGLVVLQIVLVSILAGVLARRAMGGIGKPAHQQGRLGGLYRRLGLAMNIILLGILAGDLYLAGWADLIDSILGPTFVLVDELLMLAPLLISWVIVQSLMYKLDRAVRQWAWQDQPSRQIWSRGRYLLFHLQASVLPVLMPLCLLIGLIDCLELLEMHLPAGRPSEVMVIASFVVGAGLIVLVTPVLIRWAWAGRAMQAGPMREKLEGMCISGKLGYRDIIVWPTGNTVANAAVMGFWGPLRYLVVTDALLKDMSQEQVQAVFAHEVGHIRGHHLPYYGLFMVGMNLLVYDCLKVVGIFLPGFEQGTSGEVLQFVMVVAGILGMFGWISRRFERDADVWSVEHTGCPSGYCEPGCPLYDLRRSEEGENPQGPPKDRLCPPATKCFAGSLQKVAMLNAIPQRARSWRHSSIGSRMELLYDLSSAGGELKRFHRRIRLIKMCLWLAAIIGGIGAIILSIWSG